jgi:hypothetical protein
MGLGSGKSWNVTSGCMCYFYVLIKILHAKNLRAQSLFLGRVLVSMQMHTILVGLIGRP